MISNYRAQTNNASLFTALKTTEDNISYNLLNCVRIGIVEEFYSDNLTAKIKIANKRQIGQNPDGTPIVEDYPPIYAKVHFLGWGNVGATFPVVQGMEGVVLFNDREIESWFINSDINPLSYDRAHSLSDAIFICGVHSIPHMIQILLDCFHLYYGNSDIRIQDKNIVHTSQTHTFNGNVTINGNLQVNGSITATGDIVANGISLINHIHSGVETGTGTTGKPQ